ncbi:hypothetical protein [Streptomyces sp. BRB081]|uniref:hypothetical protein n=1 Tax=Streptomyces sp. BRB081 TaxID=2769544 RepID=UPI0018ACA850|nr:hypothetical protein [Streptomyces sp. BRB081]MBL3808338.1 hypothetical protein [Streptomyces sp. BRB081]
MNALAMPHAPSVVRLTEWDFGDFPYGLEPLFMPPAAHTGAGVARPPLLPSCDPRRICRELDALTGSGPTAARLDVVPPSSHTQLFWFRWMTGHQVSFALWRLMGRAVEHVAEPAGGGHRPGALAELETYTHAYSAMLLYSASCPRSLYQSLIRPALALQHRAFSGTWAPDFAQVRSLLRGRPLPWLRQPGAAGLRAALDAQRMVHDSVAARLVPNGRSLLQQAIHEQPVRSSERTAVLYDNFFMTLRGPVTDGQVAGQLLRRLRAVALDLAGNGLYPLGSDEAEENPDGWESSVGECERRLFSVLADTAARAADVARESTTAGPAQPPTAGQPAT